MTKYGWMQGWMDGCLKGENKLILYRPGFPIDLLINQYPSLWLLCKMREGIQPLVFFVDAGTPPDIRWVPLDITFLS